MDSNNGLDYYRAKATFNIYKLKLFLRTEEILKYEEEIYNYFEKHPEYQTDPTYPHSLTVDQLRHKSTRQFLAENSFEFLSFKNVFSNPKKAALITKLFYSFAAGAHIKNTLNYNMYLAAVCNLGTERHSKFVEACEKGQTFGCYCLTEIAHGSNTKGMKTTATYDKKKQKFILNTPDFEAAKCWAGNLGQTATIAIVFAQLIIDGKNYGLHNFLVPIRDRQTLLPYPGVRVADLGEKVGLNGVDNGVLMFENYEIPRENLLNRTADVTENGEYVSMLSTRQRHGAVLGTLMAGRTVITGIAEINGIKALTIAIRYAAVRKQFGPNENEISIIEYPTHQMRLLPYLAAVYILHVFNPFFGDKYFDFHMKTMLGKYDEISPNLAMELHGISSGTKPVATWLIRDAIQECREACGGHGYLKAAGFADLKNDFDANLTYEGENHVLIQQTGNWLLKHWPLVIKRKKISSPLHSLDFLNNGIDILNTVRCNASSIEDLCQPEEILNIYNWLVCYLLKKSYVKLERDLRSGKSDFEARNSNQVYCCKNLSIAFIQRYFLQTMLNKINESPSTEIRKVLLNLFLLYGLWSLERHIPTLYEGGYTKEPTFVTILQDSILKLCNDLKDDAVALIDALAPPDWVINSVLGFSDGMVYKHLEKAVFGNSYNTSRPTWWKDLANYQKDYNPKSKL